MKLVVDANILFSFFLKDSKTREIIISFDIFEFYTPAFALEELLHHKEEICRKCKISEEEFKEIFNYLSLFVKIIPEEKFKDLARKASEISPHEKDIPYFALALKIKCPIWSSEKAFKNQTKIKVFSTKDLVEVLK